MFALSPVTARFILLATVCIFSLSKLSYYTLHMQFLFSKAEYSKKQIKYSASYVAKVSKFSRTGQFTTVEAITSAPITVLMARQNENENAGQMSQ